ncbi:MAG: hypothetical protein WC547_08800 [Candidatus Omnitrophota bacterium]
MADIKTTPPPATGQPDAQPAQAQKAVASAGIFGIGALKEKFQAVIKAGPQQLDISVLNFGLMAIIGILIIFFIRNTSISWTNLKVEAAKEYKVIPVTKAESGFKEIATMKGVAYYVGKLSGRNIFRRETKSEGISMDEPIFSSKMADMTANLKLVGISMSNDPDAMIEDTKLQKTYFVKTGTMIGDLRVDDITKDNVVLKYNKELFELR